MASFTELSASKQTKLFIEIIIQNTSYILQIYEHFEKILRAFMNIFY